MLMHCPGVQLSPSPADAPEEGSETAAAPTSAAIELTPEGGDEWWASSEWEEAQAHDPDIQIVKRYVETRVTPKGPERQASYYLHYT